MVPVAIMNFGDRRVFVRIPFYSDTLFSGLSMRDVPPFSLVTAHDRKITQIVTHNV